MTSEPGPGGAPLRRILHVDMDAFYASVEQRDDPSLRGRPVAVGGAPDSRGVVAAASYEARAFGVRSALPMARALRLCPGLVVVRPDFTKYRAVSRQVFDLFCGVTPLVEPLSLDEAYLDVTENAWGEPLGSTVARRLKAAIREATGLTASAGVAPNKFLAKIASDLDKPAGFSVIGAAEALDFLADKPVSILPGVGPAFAKALARDGYSKIRDLRRPEPRELAARYGEAGLRLARLARAEDARPVDPSSGRKSISAETTFEKDLHKPADLEAALWRLAVKVTDRAKTAETSGEIVVLKLKTAEHKIRTRRRTLAAPTKLAEDVFRAARELLGPEADGTRFRLIGVGLSALHGAGPDALDLLDPNAARRAAAERAVDKARARFGADAVGKGRGLLGKKAEREEE